MTAAQSVTAQFNGLPVPLPLPPATLPVGALNVSYPFTFAAIGGTQPYSCALSSGVLPRGLGLDSTTGALTGIPMQIGTYSFQITVTDAVSATATPSYSVTVSAIVPPIPTVSGGALWAMMLLTLALGVVMLRRRSRWSDRSDAEEMTFRARARSVRPFPARESRASSTARGSDACDGVTAVPPRPRQVRRDCRRDPRRAK
jgi:Putative Ig domain